MQTSVPKNQACCTKEKERLMDELRRCEFCTSSYDEFQQCYSSVARESGERSRSCMTSA